MSKVEETIFEQRSEFVIRPTVEIVCSRAATVFPYDNDRSKEMGKMVSEIHTRNIKSFCFIASKI